MEQLISAATIPFCIMFALLVFGFGLIGASICSFLFLKVEDKNIHTIFILGVIMLIPGFYFRDIFDKYFNLDSADTTAEPTTATDVQGGLLR